MNPSVNQRSVLIVHPDPSKVQSWKSTLQARGYEVRYVENAERAIDAFSHRAYDILLTEYSLPGRNAEKMVETIRWSSGGDQVAVVLLQTNPGSLKTLEDARDRMDALLVRPLPQTQTALLELVKSVEQALLARNTRVVTAEQIEREARAAGDPTKPTRMKEGKSKHTPKSPPWPEGSLQKITFARVLGHAHSLSVQGKLVLSRNDDPRPTIDGQPPRKVIYLNHGSPIATASNLVQECLGQILVKSKAIDPEQLNESIRRMRRGEGQQGSILVRMGALDERNLEDALRSQALIKFWDLFAWNTGAYLFGQAESMPTPMNGFELRFDKLLMEGIQRSMSSDHVLEELAPFMQMQIKTVTGNVYQTQWLTRFTQGYPMVSSLNGSRKLGELLDELGRHKATGARLLYAMQCMHLLEYEGTIQPGASRASKGTSPKNKTASPSPTATSIEIPIGSRKRKS